MPSLQIVLATHNSSRHLAAQLDSLFAQTCQDFTILVADDASTDATPALLVDYAARYPGRLEMLAFDRPAGGAKENFARALDRVTADLVMFCDHDDVWLPEKIALSLAAMVGADDGTPRLVHTDLVVVDQELATIAPSFWAYSRTKPQRCVLHQLLVQNVVTGCTVLANRALYEMARPIPPDAVMHDYWIGLVASARGRMIAVPQALVLYRQHGANTLGAKPWSNALMLWQAIAGIVTFNDTLFRVNARAIAATSRQAAALGAQLAPTLTASQQASIDAAATMWQKPRLLRFVWLLQRGISMDGLLRNLGLLIALTFYDQDQNIP